MLTLPAGSLWAGKRWPAARWSKQEYDAANVLDYLQLINLRLGHLDTERLFDPIERPGEREERERAKARARETRRRLEETVWEEDDDG